MAELPTAPPLYRSCIALVAAAILLAGGIEFRPAQAQQMETGRTSKKRSPLSYPETPPPAKRAKLPQENGRDQMLVQAQRIDYDYNNRRVSAVGKVQIYYSGSTLEADRVTYDEKTKRLRAEGNAKLTDPEGNITYGELMDLSDDYRDGFVDSLHLERADRTSLAAARANRTGGNFTVFDSAVYTACLPCRDNPKKPPLWQVKAARIIHDQNEKMIYFEDARLEFFGTPLAYIPFFSTPDQTVKRKTGFLMPSTTTNTIYGAALETPYYFALAPNYDATISPMFTTRQGPLLQGEFRQRLMDGAYAVRAAGIYQLDRNAIPDGAPGDRFFRGTIESSGQFALNQNWVWGWDAIAMTDKAFLNDYRPRLSAYSNGIDPSKIGTPGASEATSQLYLTGKGNRSYFDIRGIYYTGLSSSDDQRKIPVIHPVIDYDYVVGQPVFGGELGFKTNFVSLNRDMADFQRINYTGVCAGANPAATASCFLLRGMPGEFDRLSTQANWRTTITDPLGQVWTPFLSLRGDAAAMSVSNQQIPVISPAVAGGPPATVSDYLRTGTNDLARGMPAVGLEYRYPFISVQSWGTQTIEPIAQVIARPDETQIGKWPNETSQSFLFDDSNLFSVNKFSGWDRVEGGGRANVGVQYTAQFNQGGNVNALVGQSYQLFGKNSFAQPDPVNTGLDSGLDHTQSDYVARLQFQPNKTYLFTSRFRFDHDDMSLERMELEARANYDRWTFGLMYGDYAAQPDIGILSRQRGVLGSASYKLDANWVVFGNALYGLNTTNPDGTPIANPRWQVTQAGIGLGYVDDCLILSVNYLYGYSYDVAFGQTPKVANAVMFQLGLRTLGESGVSQHVSPSQH
ncbi:MAG TPA: LPS-assembly protein LptD [Pseudolabrys sp.]|nr:LPS-assembly protein LptD [Pseudolabrys sp.]